MAQLREDTATGGVGCQAHFLALVRVAIEAIATARTKAAGTEVRRLKLAARARANIRVSCWRVRRLSTQECAHVSDHSSSRAISSTSLLVKRKRSASFL